MSRRTMIMGYIDNRSEDLNDADDGKGISMAVMDAPPHLPKQTVCSRITIAVACMCLFAVCGNATLAFWTMVVNTQQAAPFLDARAVYFEDVINATSDSLSQPSPPRPPPAQRHTPHRGLVHRFTIFNSEKRVRPASRGSNNDRSFGGVPESTVQSIFPRWFARNGTWDADAALRDLVVVVAQLAAAPDPATSG